MYIYEIILTKYFFFLQRSQDAKMTKALLLALGVCYHSSLKSREEYREYITDYFASPLELPRGEEEMKREITRYTNCS